MAEIATEAAVAAPSDPKTTTTTREENDSNTNDTNAAKISANADHGHRHSSSSRRRSSRHTDRDNNDRYHHRRRRSRSHSPHSRSKPYHQSHDSHRPHHRTPPNGPNGERNPARRNRDLEKEHDRDRDRDRYRYRDGDRSRNRDSYRDRDRRHDRDRDRHRERSDGDRHKRKDRERESDHKHAPNEDGESAAATAAQPSPQPQSQAPPPQEEQKSELEEQQRKAAKAQARADQIEMYKAYEEMFGVEEAAAMMGFDRSALETHGVELLVSRLEQEKEDARAAQFAASLPININPTVAIAQIQAGATYNGIPTNENLIDFDSAPGTTHTAGGGTVSRPPPTHVCENACVFVGDLHPMVTRSDLLSVFSGVGQVQWIQLFDCHKQMNRPFNFAFVYFASLETARVAIGKLNYTKFYNSPCRLMWKQQKHSVQWTDCNIIVKNLPASTDSQLLHAVFSQFGRIVSSKVKTTGTGRTLPYGYVQYADKYGAEAAIHASARGQLSVLGQPLSAEWFKSREDRAFRQIYVKNIPGTWTDQHLLQLFEAQTLGKIKSFTLKPSPYGRWACISFHEADHAVRAIERLNGCPTGDAMAPTLSVSRFMYKTERDKVTKVSTVNTDACFSIYVGNVPLQLTDEHMRQLFEPFGAVLSAAVVQKTHDYKYGFVNFEQPEDAARALLTMNGKSIGGKTMQVKPANTDMSKAIAISQAADFVSLAQVQQPPPQQQMQQIQQIQMQQQMEMASSFGQEQQPQPSPQQQQPMTTEQAQAILRADTEQGEKVWKVQYAQEWHEYDTTLAAIVEQLAIGEQIQITLADSNYIITRVSETEAMQKNCASGTMRRVLRSFREVKP